MPLLVSATKPLRSLARRAVHALGWELYKRPVRMNGLWAHLQDLFAQQRIDCVFDVGAHYGEYALELRSYGYTGRIISFEPCLESYEILLQQSANDPLWTCHNFALGATDEGRALNVMRDTRFCSFLEPTHDALEWSEQGCSIERSETVQVRRLDGLMEQLGLPEGTRCYLKVDTQGAERDVLVGATGVLPSIVALQAEVPVRPLYNGVLDFREFVDELEHSGYALTGLFPAAQENDLRVLEFDCVMLRAQAAPGKPNPAPFAKGARP